jgi:chromosomal replication initiator protein
MISYTAARNPPTKPIEFRIFSDDFGLGIAGSFPRGRITVAAIQAEVADYFDVPAFELRSSRRSKSVVLARHIAIYLSRELTPKSLPEIGRLFGDRDHTTIIHAIGRIGGLCGTDQKLAADVATLRERLAA